MEFVNYKTIPRNDYTKTANGAINYIKQYISDKNKTKELFNLINSASRFEEVTEKSSSYHPENQEQIGPFNTALLTLFSLLHPDQQSVTKVCEAYRIDQAHIAYADENNLFTEVKTLALGALFYELE